jgi:serine/threonine protein kinase
MLGRTVGSYRIVEKIGEGGIGAVYRAVDEMLDREVAIKAIRPELARDPEIVERFRAEAKILARVHHPVIATIYSFFHDGGELFLAMEFVRGRTLGALPWRRAARDAPRLHVRHHPPRLRVRHDRLSGDAFKVVNGLEFPALSRGIEASASLVMLRTLALRLVFSRDPDPERDALYSGHRLAELVSAYIQNPRIERLPGRLGRSLQAGR